jgi:uncharacterized radical SAM superfamily Fe-S cluster-containing enzyme/CTP:molybdopterin cytidylyltransferase MocA
VNSRPQDSLAALVLAAGYSSRMGEFKPLLPIGSSTAIERAIDVFLAAGIADVTVVTGHRAEDLRSVLQRKGVREVFNPDFDKGMYSSVVAGARSLRLGVSACFVLPADMPLVLPGTVQSLASAFGKVPASVLYPMFQERRGHPPLIRRDVLEEALQAEPADGLRGLLARRRAVREIEVADEGIHLDMDTPADLDRLRALAEAITGSVCPICLRRVDARRVVEGSNVYLAKTCPEHGDFRTVVWRGLPSYQSWGSAKKAPSRAPACATTVNEGCPFDCGLCTGHRQHTCCVVMEVTQRCNLSCRICFAGAGDGQPDPSLDTIENWCRRLLDSGGPFNLQLSGGEPTVRDDLPRIVELARSLGFGFIQLNTNGVRLAADPDYAGVLKRAGLGCVFLQFDSTTDVGYRQIRGRALLETKLAAIRNCRENELGVVLVPTLVPGVNIGQIGEIIRFAIGQMPAVRAVHFQPVSYFGRYPGRPSDADRITLPEVLREIERQTQGRLPASQFFPPSAENAWCSFQGKFVVQPDGSIQAAPNPPSSGCCGSAASLVQLEGGGGARRAQQFVARHWAFPDPPAAPPVDSLDEFLVRDRNTLCVSGMAFQDAWNLDLDRLRDCFLHAVTNGGRLVPLCAYNLTAAGGRALYRTGERDV